MDLIDAHDSLQFHNDEAFDNQINALPGNLDTSVADVNGTLALERHLAMLKFDAHRLSVDRLETPGS